MPRDLFAEMQSPNAAPQQVSNQPRDLFAENKVDTTGLLGKVDTAALGFSKSTIENIGVLGTLANNILKLTTKALPDSIGQNIKESLDYAGSLGQKGIQAASDYFSPSTDFERRAVAENPRLYGAAGAAGTVGTQVAGMSALNPVTNTIDAGLTKVAPSLGEQPIIKGAINQGAQAFGLGAANTPDNPIQGGLNALPLGVALGAAGGAIGQKLQRAGDTLDFEQQNAMQAGISPYSYEAVARQKNQLKAGGVDYAKNVVGKQLTSEVKNIIDQVAPGLKDGEMPGETMARIASQNYPQVKASVAADFKPLVDATQKFVPENTVNTIASLSAPVKKLLPDVKLPDNATFNEMWQYRQALDENMRILATKAKDSVIASKQLYELNGLRANVTNDMMGAANKMGLADQFQKGIDNYTQNLLPFNVFKTDLRGSELSQKAIDDMMTKFNRFTMSKMPNINDVKQIAATLGEEGKKSFGWALLQKSMLDSQDAKGIVNTKNLYTRVRKYNNMGVFRILGGTEVSKAVKGIQAIADGADEMLRQGKPQNMVDDFIAKVTPNLLGSWGGRKLLETLGGSRITNVQRRQMIGNLISGTLIINKSQKDNGKEGLF